MLKRMLLILMAALLAVPMALAEPDGGELARLQARVEELEEENAQLKALLSQESSARLLAARFRGGVITIEEAKAEYEYRSYIYASMGMDESEYEDIIKEEVLNDLVEDGVLMLKARELGVYAPDAGEAEQIAAQAQQSYEEMVAYYLPFLADPAKSDAENRATVEAYLESEETTLEGMIESMTAQAWRDRLFVWATQGLELGDDELREYFDSACETAQLTYTADPASYETDRMNGEAVLWNPPGYRRVKRILVAFDGDAAAEMAELSAKFEEVSGEAEVSALLERMDALYTTLDPIIEEILTRVGAGDDFNLLIDEYGDDPYIQTEHGRADGYYIGAQSALLDEEFAAEAMALQEPGDISAPIQGADGIYILRYEAEVPAGAVEYEAFLADAALREGVEESIRKDAYNRQVEAWLAEAEIERYPENF